MSRKLRHKIADVSKRRLIPATIIDGGGGLCSVRIGKRGAVLHGVPYTGGPVFSGQGVFIDMSSGNPLVTGYGSEVVLPETRKPIPPRSVGAEIVDPWSRIQDNYQGITIDLYTSGSAKYSFSVTDEGFQQAITTGSDGGYIVLPSVQLTGDYTLPDGMTVRGFSKTLTSLYGSITLQGDAVIDNMTIIKVVSSGSNPAVAVDLSSTASKTAFVTNCDLYVSHGGTGEARIFDIGVNRSLYSYNNTLSPTASSGSDAYAFYFSSISGSYAFGSLCIVNTDTLVNENLGSPNFEIISCHLQSKADYIEYWSEDSDREKSGHYHSLQAVIARAGTVVEGEYIPLYIYNKDGGTRNIKQIFLSAGDPPIGASLRVDIEKNWEGSIFSGTGNMPSIASSGSTGGSSTIQSPLWREGSFIRAKIDQAGSSNPGGNLLIHIVYDVVVEGYKLGAEY